MDILLLGYFGQDNFGDEAINRATMRFLLREFGSEINIHLCNQSNYTENVTGKFEENCEGLSNFNTYEVWFDSINHKKYDMVAICNSGFTYGFCLDVAMDAADKGIPLRIYSMKQPRPNGMRGEVYDYVLDKCEFAIFRIEEHYNSFNIKNDRVVDGMDLAYFNETYPTENNGQYVLIAPRFYNDENANKQIDFINTMADGNKNYEFRVFKSSKDDHLLAKKIENFDNLSILESQYTNIRHQVDLIKSASKIISLGRYHPLLYGLKYRIPSVYLNTGYYSDHYLMDKTKNICNEFNISSKNNQIFNVEKIKKNYNIDLLNKRIERTLNAIGIDLNY